jgi:hypothetical protein
LEAPQESQTARARSLTSESNILKPVSVEPTVWHDLQMIFLKGMEMGFNWDELDMNEHLAFN